MTTFLTTAQAAALLNITPNYLRQLVYRKKISQVYPGLFDPQEIERYKHETHKTSMPLDQAETLYASLKSN
jgi:excisionase family DNA binding protein